MFIPAMLESDVILGVQRVQIEITISIDWIIQVKPIVEIRDTVIVSHIYGVRAAI